MALSKQVTKKSLEKLRKQYTQLSEPTNQLLEQVNSIAARNDLMLSDQPKKFLDELVTKLSKGEETAEEIMQWIEIWDKKDAEEGQKIVGDHNRGGIYNRIPLHQRTDARACWLQDHDMDSLMPKETDSIQIFKNLKKSDLTSKNIFTTGIRAALDTKETDHVFLTMSSGQHWQGIYITKPTAQQPQYQIELFDPKGRGHSSNMQKFADNVMKNIGISPALVQYHYPGPPVPQEDSYACGDFTCAYSHQKMSQLLGKKPGLIASALIQRLEKPYSKPVHLLRSTTHQLTEWLTQQKELENTLNNFKPNEEADKEIIEQIKAALQELNDTPLSEESIQRFAESKNNLSHSKDFNKLKQKILSLEAITKTLQQKQERLNQIAVATIPIPRSPTKSRPQKNLLDKTLKMMKQQAEMLEHWAQMLEQNMTNEQVHRTVSNLERQAQMIRYQVDYIRDLSAMAMELHNNDNEVNPSSSTSHSILYALSAAILVCLLVIALGFGIGFAAGLWAEPISFLAGITQGSAAAQSVVFSGTTLGLSAGMYAFFQPESKPQQPAPSAYSMGFL